MRATMRIIQSSSKVGLFMGNSGLGVDVCLRGNSGVEMSCLVERRKNPCMAFRCFILARLVDGMIW